MGGNEMENYDISDWTILITQEGRRFGLLMSGKKGI